MTRILTAFAVVGMLMTGMAYADAMNVRPVAFGPGTVGEDSLQQVLDDLVVSGTPIDAVNDQTPYALFTSGGTGGSVATFIVEITANAATQTFGLYSADDPTNRAEIFSGADTPGIAGPSSQALVSFLANGDIWVNFVPVATGFSSTFGFYLGTGGTYYYSEDSLNPAGDAQALIYQGAGQTTQIDPYSPGTFAANEFIVAFEDQVLANSDGDFQDLVVMVESIVPVPAPGAVVLGMVGLGLVGWVRRQMR